jgi:hypothetical protein
MNDLIPYMIAGFGGYLGGYLVAKLHNAFDRWREKRKKEKPFRDFVKNTRKTYKRLYGERMP